VLLWVWVVGKVLALQPMLALLVLLWLAVMMVVVVVVIVTVVVRVLDLLATAVVLLLVLKPQYERELSCTLPSSGIIVARLVPSSFMTSPSTFRMGIPNDG
jgi:hypothetical protein